MIDTIAIKIKIDDFQGEYIDFVYFNKLINKIERLRNCNIRKKLDDEILIMLSFPRFYSRTNAYLLTQKEKCRKVNREFIIDILDYEDKKYNMWLEDRIEINLLRIDIPITYIMKNNNNFNDYRNIFFLLEKVYKKESKRIVRDGEIETIMLYDGKTKDSSNSKITIYNQYKKFENMYPKYINELNEEFKDLRYRIRIELSKRIRRKGLTIKEFKRFDFYEKYISNYVQEIENLLFDDNEIERVWENQIMLLVNRYKNSLSRLEIFLLENLNDIWDYKIMREVLNRTIENENTFYKKCFQVRRFLEKEEEKTGIIYFRIKEILYDMKKSCRLTKGERKYVFKCERN